MPKNPDVVSNMRKEERRRRLRKANKSLKRNRDERRPRNKGWSAALDADGDEWLDQPAYERIMPRGERERRRSVEALMQVEAPAMSEERPPASPPAANGVQGRVVGVSAGLCRVQLPGRTLLCSMRGSLTAVETGYTNVVAAGDRVLVSQDGRDQGVVERVLPRDNQISRPDPFYTHLRQTLAANVDQLLIVASWRDPHLWPELVDRYLIAAECNSVTPVLCINKVDLAESLEEVEEVVGIYRALDYRVFLTSATQGYGLRSLRALLDAGVTVLAGLSGVGKSTLLTAIQPELDLRIGAVNPDRHQGRHTTSQAVMLPLDERSYVIDTPGIREFGLAGLHQSELIAYYPELAAAAAGCRFSDCTHDHEPACAVRAAVERGEVSAMRLDNYKKIRCTLPE